MVLYEIFQIFEFWSKSRGGAHEYVAVVETGNTAAPEHYIAIDYGLLFGSIHAITASVVQLHAPPDSWIMTHDGFIEYLYQ